MCVGLLFFFLCVSASWPHCVSGLNQDTFNPGWVSGWPTATNVDTTDNSHADGEYYSPQMILRLITMAAAATATAEHSRGLHIGVRLREVSDLLPVLRVKYCERGYYRKKGMVEKEDEVEESENEEPEEANERRRRRIRQQN